MKSQDIPDSKVHGANMGPIWGRQDPGGTHVGPMNFVVLDQLFHNIPSKKLINNLISISWGHWAYAINVFIVRQPLCVCHYSAKVHTDVLAITTMLYHFS